MPLRTQARMPHVRPCAPAWRSSATSCATCDVPEAVRARLTVEFFCGTPRAFVRAHGHRRAPHAVRVDRPVAVDVVTRPIGRETRWEGAMKLLAGSLRLVCAALLTVATLALLVAPVRVGLDEIGVFVFSQTAEADSEFVDPGNYGANYAGGLHSSTSGSGTTRSRRGRTTKLSVRGARTPMCRSTGSWATAKRCG